MKIILSARKCLIIILWLVSIHSFFVGLGLIFMPASLMPFFGFEVSVENFFPVQGGVFHLVMATAYALAAIGMDRFGGLILITIVAKFMATVFLLIYYFAVDKVWTVLLSAVGDILMGMVILLVYLYYSKVEKYA